MAWTIAGYLGARSGNTSDNFLTWPKISRICSRCRCTSGRCNSQLGNNSTGLHRIKVDSFTQCGRQERMKGGDSSLSAGVTRGPQLVTCGDGSVAADLLIILAGVRRGCRVRIQDDPRRISVRDGRPHLWHMRRRSVDRRVNNGLWSSSGRRTGRTTTGRAEAAAHRAETVYTAPVAASYSVGRRLPGWIACRAAASIVTAQMTRLQPTN